ncbi:hypothetical protein ON010_g3256 [Phytophthora cinnamomi]|nr:hypothetical protein ON010_g3256 [Phytophthora cinnamomi]
MNWGGGDGHDGAKRRGVSIGPQASRGSYEPNLGPGSPVATAQHNHFSPAKRPFPAQNAVLKPSSRPA